MWCGLFALLPMKKDNKKEINQYLILYLKPEKETGRINSPLLDKGALIYYMNVVCAVLQMAFCACQHKRKRRELPAERSAARGEQSRKRSTFLTGTGIKSMTRKSGSTNASPFPLLTGTSRPKRRNGGRHGRGFAIRRWSRTDTRSA